MSGQNSFRTEARYLLLKTQGRKVPLDNWTEAELLGFDHDAPMAYYMMESILKRSADTAFVFLLQLRRKEFQAGFKGQGGDTISNDIYKQIFALIPQCTSKVLLQQLPEARWFNTWEVLGKRNDWDARELRGVGEKINTNDPGEREHINKITEAIIARWGDTPEQLSRICSILGKNEVIVRRVYTFLVSRSAFPATKLLEFCEVHSVNLSRDEKAKLMHSRMGELRKIAAVD